MKLTKAQKKMVERIAKICADEKWSLDGFCENYDVTDGHELKKQCLNNLIKKGVVIKYQSKQKRRGGFYGASYSDDGFTLYKLSPVGIKMVYERIKKEEEENTFDKRLAKRLADMRITDGELKKALTIK